VKSSGLTLVVLPSHRRLGQGWRRALMVVRRRVLLNGPRCHHRRNRMLEDQLLLVAGFENKGIFVKAFDPPGKFDTAQKINGDQSLFLARIIQKTVLDVLRRFVHLFTVLALNNFLRMRTGPIEL
jgi:hypothetical protein